MEIAQQEMYESTLDESVMDTLVYFYFHDFRGRCEMEG